MHLKLLILLIYKIDKFFHTLNVSSIKSGKHHRKPFQDPIRGPSDFRIKVRYLHLTLLLCDTWVNIFVDLFAYKKC